VGLRGRRPRRGNGTAFFISEFQGTRELLESAGDDSERGSVDILSNVQQSNCGAAASRSGALHGRHHRKQSQRTTVSGFTMYSQCRQPGQNRDNNILSLPKTLAGPLAPLKLPKPPITADRPLEWEWPSVINVPLFSL